MLTCLSERVGFRKFELDAERSVLTKAHPRLQFDCSAIAKGFAVDVAAAALANLGVEHFLIEAGGEIRAAGGHADGRPWRVGVERPAADDSHRRVYRKLALGAGAVATSGTYRNYFERDGVRYSHTLDPRTGRPVSHRLAAVTVVAQTAVLADAWSTALLVAGEIQGPALAEQLGIAAYFITALESTTEAGQFKDTWTTAMRAYLS